GRVYRPGNDEARPLAPLARINDREYREGFAVRLITTMIALRGVQITPTRLRLVREALESIATQPKRRSITGFNLTVQDADIRSALEPYEGGFLDGSADDLDFEEAIANGVTPFFVFDYRHIDMDDEQSLVPALLYIDNRITAALDPRRPSAHFYDEIWRGLKSPVFT